MATSRIIDTDAWETDGDAAAGSDLEADFGELEEGLVLHVLRSDRRGHVDVVAYRDGEIVHDETVRSRDVLEHVFGVLQKHVIRGARSTLADVLRGLAEDLEG